MEFHCFSSRYSPIRYERITKKSMTECKGREGTVTELPCTSIAYGDFFREIEAVETKLRSSEQPDPSNKATETATMSKMLFVKARSVRSSPTLREDRPQRDNFFPNAPILFTTEFRRFTFQTRGLPMTSAPGSSKRHSESDLPFSSPQFRLCEVFFSLPLNSESIDF